MKRRARLDRLGAALRDNFPEFGKHERAFPAVAAQDVLAAPHDTHEERTRDAAYVGGTAFGTGSHGIPVSVEGSSTTYQSLLSWTVR